MRPGTIISKALPKAKSAEAFATLPQPQQQVIELSYYEGLSPLEIATRLDQQVDAVKTADEQSKLAEAKIEVTAGSSSIDIRTHYPERTNHNPANVEYTLHVPRKARLDKIDLVNGRIKIEGIDGFVRAASVNGSVEATQVAGEVARAP